MSTLGWGVKRSFREYVMRANGTVSFAAPAYWADDEFRFPADTGSPTEWLGYSGEVLFLAYGGLLQVRIAAPRLEPAADGVVLTADTGTADSADRIPIVAVNTSWRELGARSGEKVRLRAWLTDAGSTLLGGSYASGTEVEPLHLEPPA